MNPDRPTPRSFELLDLLTHLGLEELQNLAHRFGLIGSSPSRRALSSQVLSRYRDREFITSLVRSLGRAESDLLSFLILLQEHREQGIAWPTWTGPTEDAAQWATSFNTLIESGLVFYNPEERSRVLIPPQIVLAVREALLADEPRPPLTDQEPLWGGTERILWMMFRLLVAAHSGSLRQTQGETFLKRDLDVWYSSLPADLLPPASVPHSVEIKEVASFLVSMGRQLGIIDIESGKLCTTEKVFLWLHQSRHTLAHNLWKIFLEQIAIRNSDWYHSLFQLVYRSSNGQPLWDVSPPRGSVSRGSLTVWLSWFGVIRVVRAGRRIVAVRTAYQGPWEPSEEKPDEQACPSTSSGYRSPSTLQPNFELMVPPDTPFATLWDIERFADHLHTDVVSVYLLTRQSIIRGLRDNLSRDEIWNRLTQLTAGRMPQNVRFSLEEWFDSFGRVQVEEVILLRCRTPEVAEEILHISEASETIRERLGPTLLAADRSRIDSLLETLERLGFAPLVRLTGAAKEQHD